MRSPFFSWLTNVIAIGQLTYYYYCHYNRIPALNKTLLHDFLFVSHFCLGFSEVLALFLISDMSGRSRNVPREFRKKVKSRSRSCDSSRSRHYDNCVEASSLKYQMRQQQYPKVSGSSRSYKYSSPKRSMKRPHYRQEDSIRYDLNQIF